MATVAKDKWFHGNIPRQQAEDLVRAAGKNGSFVVRISESVHGAYALSLLFHGKVHTYRILTTPDGGFAVQTSSGVQKRKFMSVDDLVEEYKTPKNGLVCGLTNPVGRVLEVPPALPERNSIRLTPPTAPPLTKILLPINSVHSSPAMSAEEAKHNCVVCMDNTVDAFFQPCGHVCCCMDCSRNVKECPLCRKGIIKFQKAYLS